MAQTHKVTRVVPRDEWSNEFGKYQTYAVQFDDKNDWIKWNKKFKDGKVEAPKEGDEVFGVVENGKFSLAKKDYAFGSTKNTKPDWQPRDDDRIVAQWAIGQAVNIYVNDKFLQDSRADFEPSVELWAKKLYAMVDRVKSGSDGSTTSQLPTQAEKPQQAALPKEDVVVMDIGDEPINLDDIPF
jgi:hypothetical protein